MDQPLSRIRIVLVGTQHPGNIGSAARAIKTMGLSRLVLVAPERFPDREADALAAGARDVLEAATLHDTLADAVADCGLVLGCTARSRRVPLPEQVPRDAAATALAEAAGGTEVALVFGRERTGLENDELQLCHGAVHIPSDPDYGSLNLAAAVQVLAYELRMGWLASSGPLPAATAPAPLRTTRLSKVRITVVSSPKSRMPLCGSSGRSCHSSPAALTRQPASARQQSCGRCSQTGAPGDTASPDGVTTRSCVPSATSTR